MSYRFDQLAATENVRFIVGNNLTMPFQIGSCVTTNNTTSFVATNITGYVFTANMTVNGTMITGNISILSAANGSMSVDYYSNSTSLLTVGCGSHAVDSVTSAGYKRTLINGTVEVLERG